MSGNVWEWVWDRFGDYSSGHQTDPTGPDSGRSVYTVVVTGTALRGTLVGRFAVVVFAMTLMLVCFGELG